MPAPVTLVASPFSPEPGEKIAVQAATPTFDRHTAHFDWTIDGKARPELSGFGKDRVELTAGDIGSAIRVSVDVSRLKAAPGVSGGAASLTIRPATLSLTYFAETLVPRWYRGKALPSSSSVVNIIALPEFVIDGRRMAPEQLVYRWTLDDQRDALAGIGEQIFRIRTSDLPDTSHEIRVVVEDIDRKIKKERTYYVVSFPPRMAIYPSSPLGGVEFRTANFFTSSRRGLFDFLAEPFFFAASTRRDLLWQWDIDGLASAGAPDTPHIVTVDSQRRPAGSLTISASAAGADTFNSSAASTLNFSIQ